MEERERDRERQRERHRGSFFFLSIFLGRIPWQNKSGSVRFFYIQLHTGSAAAGFNYCHYGDPTSRRYSGAWGGEDKRNSLQSMKKPTTLYNFSNERFSVLYTTAHHSGGYRGCCYYYCYY